MGNLAKGTFIVVTGACLTLITCTTYATAYAGAAVDTHGKAAYQHASQTALADPLANRYVLTGHGVQVTYDSTGLAGQPQLVYRDQQRTLHFSGSAIRQVDSDAGTLVSVTTVMSIDTGSTTFSLLIPRVTVHSGRAAHIRTLGITTTHRLTIDTPVHGQLDTYQVHPLMGTASVVEF